jgi:hypothetical protein
VRVAVIELYVDVSRRRRTAGELSDGDAVMRTLRAHPDERNALALEAIEVAAAFEPAVIVCPGWTFVGRAPRTASLRRAAGDAVLLCEVLGTAGQHGAGATLPRREPGEPAGLELPWRTVVLERDVVRELPGQTVTVSGQLDDSGCDTPRRLAAALKDGRRLVSGVVLVCAEVNAVRRRVEPGHPVRYGWDERIATAGVSGRDLSGALVLNPAHTPAGSYVRDKRRAGPWRAIVSTANTLDRSRLGRPALAAPAHAVVAGQDQEPSTDPVELGDGGSRVVVFEVGGSDRA